MDDVETSVGRVQIAVHRIAMFYVESLERDFFHWVTGRRQRPSINTMVRRHSEWRPIPINMGSYGQFMMDIHQIAVVSGLLEWRL